MIRQEDEVIRHLVRLRLFKWTAVALFLVAAVAQLFRPVKFNPPIVAHNSIESHLQIDSPVADILGRACADCHSNQTKWPWYSEVAPVSWFVIDHVNEGRREVNFSTWGDYTEHRAEETLGAISKSVENGSMPLSSYTALHPEAQLTPDERKLLVEWARTERLRARARASQAELSN